jgi:hypothetical protein
MILIPGGPLQAALNVTDATGLRVAAASGPTLTLRRNGSIVTGLTLTVATISAGFYVITGTADASWLHGDQITLDADTGSTGAGEVQAWTVVILPTVPTAAANATAVAAALLVTPANKLLTDGTGQVAASNLPTVPTAAANATAVATALLVTPANKLLTDGSGQVTATNGGGGSSGGTITDFTPQALAQLNGIKFVGPLTLQEGSPRQLVAGDDYSGSRSIVFESEALPNLSTASSITFSARRIGRDSTLAITATSVVYSTSPRKLSVTLTAIQTRVSPGWYEFDIEAIVAGQKQTVVGPGVRIEILADQTR